MYVETDEIEEVKSNKFDDSNEHVTVVNIDKIMRYIGNDLCNITFKRENNIDGKIAKIAILDSELVGDDYAIHHTASGITVFVRDKLRRAVSGKVTLRVMQMIYNLSIHTIDTNIVESIITNDVSSVNDWSWAAGCKIDKIEIEKGRGREFEGAFELVATDRLEIRNMKINDMSYMLSSAYIGKLVISKVLLRHVNMESAFGRLICDRMYIDNVCVDKIKGAGIFRECSIVELVITNSEFMSINLDSIFERAHIKRIIVANCKFENTVCSNIRKVSSIGEIVIDNVTTDEVSKVILRSVESCVEGK